MLGAGCCGLWVVVVLVVLVVGLWLWLFWLLLWLLWLLWLVFGLWFWLGWAGGGCAGAVRGLWGALGVILGGSRAVLASPPTFTVTAITLGHHVPENVTVEIRPGTQSANAYRNDYERT